MKISFYIAVFSALLTGGLIKAAPALAQTNGQSEIAVSLVRTSDLNLGTAAGQKQLDLRLAHAAREVCGTASDVDIEGKNEVRKCRDETLAKAQVQKSSVMAAAGNGTTIAITASR